MTTEKQIGKSITQINISNSQPTTNNLLSTLPWSDSSDLLQLLYFKEKLKQKERNINIYRNNNINPMARAFLFEWIMEICFVCRFRRVTYYLAIDYTDRYLSKIDKIDENTLDLVGITCLVIAMKVQEIENYRNVSGLVFIAECLYTVNDIIIKETEILRILKWNVNPMTIHEWICLYLQLVSVKVDDIREKLEPYLIYPKYSAHVFMRACVLSDLCSYDDGMLQFKYSTIAASILYFFINTADALFASGYRLQNIKSCIEWIQPFAVVMSRILDPAPLVVFPQAYQQYETILDNSRIVVEGGDTLQNHIINLDVLEKVYNEIKLMRSIIKHDNLEIVTGWTASNTGYDLACAAAVNKNIRKEIKNRKIQNRLLKQKAVVTIK